ncbi:MAG: hypothetical protein ACXWDI_09725 [Nocardioides sp.]
MITYLIRRIAAALVLLFVVSVITFSIFYLVPRLAGASPGRAPSWQARRQSQSADRRVQVAGRRRQISCAPGTSTRRSWARPHLRVDRGGSWTAL